ncbi:heavy metal translocating P-type ATPase, partial [Nitratireductor sp. ZSWI3]|uniref:heavy metal translocating P-type ATPase n=1 Tax=Nitratireductor sp. ZSWI3 TaxID=2966359 RepID=UPI00214FB325
AAEGGRARFRRIADRASALYSPVVHVTAFLTFLGWLLVTGDWHRAITVAIAVLIITCPCALGLAVPIVQVVAARRLFENGVMVKDGAAMEKLAEIDTVVFDKTGTLTLGVPRLKNADQLGETTLALAAAVAAHSRHPFSRAIVRAAASATGKAFAFDTVREFPGLGIEAHNNGATWRLGRAKWALSETASDHDLQTGTVLVRNGRKLADFRFEDTLRPGTPKAVERLREKGIGVEIISGDSERQVGAVADRLGITAWRAGALPGEKLTRLSQLADSGHKTLMVGDGLNDAPALAAAHVSMAPASAADIGRNAADFVFLRESLVAVPLTFDVAKRAGRLIRQNFVLAIGYNLLAVPVAILGHVTPLLAAVAMSLSSLIVIGNALRLQTDPDLIEPADRAVPATTPFPEPVMEAP